MIRPTKGKVLVTGGCGYIGSHVTRQLSEAGFDVVVLDDLSTGSPDALVNGELLIEGTTTDFLLVDELFDTYSFNSVMHFAGSIIVPQSVTDPLKYYENNTAATLTLLSTCVRKKTKHFVFSSTASVYGDNLEASLSENYPLKPTNPYSRSKLMSEWMIEDITKAHPSLRYVTLRYFNVAGADPKGRMGQRTPQATHLIKVASEAIVGKRNGITVFGTDYPTPDGTGVRDYIHVEDLASAHLSALAYLENGGPSATLNCGYGRGFSVHEVLNEIERVAGPLEVSTGPRRAGDVPSLIANVSAIHRTLKWKPKYDNLTDIVQSAIQWERQLSKNNPLPQPFLVPKGVNRLLVPKVD